MTIPSNGCGHTGAGGNVKVAKNEVQDWGCHRRHDDLLIDRGFHEADIPGNDSGALQSDQLH